MSYGSISPEAHQTLAIAMNRLGGKSNTGEGGEDPDRFPPDPNGDLRRSAIKQVASGPVRRHQRVPGQRRRHPDQDGAGRQARRGRPAARQQGLPVGRAHPALHAGRRPDQPAAAPRHLLDRGPQAAHPRPEERQRRRRGSTSSWSPRSGSARSRPGVSKAHADVVLISGHDGGTGAAPLTSLKHAGSPVGARPGRDPADAAGQRPARPDRRAGRRADEDRPGRDRRGAAGRRGVRLRDRAAGGRRGCVMMRVCHLDTCPVGVATQNPELRKRFTGQPEFVVTFFEFLAEQVREYLAELGFRSIDEAIGHAELLDTRKAVDHWKAAGLDLSPMLAVPGAARGRAAAPGHATQDHGLDIALDQTLIQLCEGALLDARPVQPRAAGAQRQPHRRHDAGLDGHPPLRRRGPARRHDRPDLRRVGRPVLRRLPAARHHDAAVGRRQRLRRQGPLRRPDRRPARAERRRSPPRTTSSPATSSATARPAARSSCAAGSASGSASATPARWPSSRASATTRWST